MRKNKQPEMTGMIFPMEYNKPYIRVVHALFMAVSIILSLVCILPVLWIFLSAFKDTKEFLQIPPSFLPKKIDFGKIMTVWSKYQFGRTFVNTIVMSAGDIVFTIAVNGLAGYVLSRLKPRGSRLIFMVVMWTMLLPSNVSQVPLFMTFTDFPLTHWNLSNTYWPMWLCAGANCYYILLFKSFFDSLSISFFESAKLDGCTNLQMFYKIVIPLSIPVMAVITIFQFNGAWGNFFWPLLLLTKPQTAVIGQKIYSMKGGTTIDQYTVAMLIVIIPPSVIYLIFQKQIIGGLTIGGVKG